MENSIIIIVCSLLILGYLFDLTSTRTRIPSVILLLLLGFIVRELTILFKVSLPNLSILLPLLGTIGLILIVLEGSLEIEVNRSNFRLIIKSFIGALLSMVALSFSLALILHHVSNISFKICLINAIPLSVISSAIAIPSVKILRFSDKAYITNESSMSDIMGVMFFNFIIFNNQFSTYTFGAIGLEILIMAVISLVATIGLSLLLNRIGHHIKFVPIILILVLIYAISKYYHLPALLFILLFGLFLGNVDKMKRLKWYGKINPGNLETEVKKFRDLAIEASFLIRSLFFLLFGYLIEAKDILNTKTILWSLGIVVIIYIFRALQLFLSRLPLRPLLYIAPRGLITVLLFLSIEPGLKIGLINDALVIQVIVITSLIMMIGMMTLKKGILNKIDIRFLKKR